MLSDITSMCEGCLNQQSPHTPQRSEERVFVCCSHIMTPPHYASIKPQQSQGLTEVCSLPPEGTLTSALVRPPHRRLQHHHLHHNWTPQTVPSNKQRWLLLRNPWRWCPSSRGNASVRPFFFFLSLSHTLLVSKNWFHSTRRLVEVFKKCSTSFCSNKKRWSVQYSV